MIYIDFIDYEEEAEDSSIYNYGAASDYEDDNVLVEVGVRICVTQSGIEEVEEVQQVVKYSSLSSYMLKTPSLLILIIIYCRKICRLVY